jgi:hypothetical protein
LAGRDVRLTIGFITRERHAAAAAALRALFDNTSVPFSLVVVDCGIPERYRREMAAVLEGRAHVETVHVDEFIFPNRARNLVLARASTPYVCLLENDSIVSPGCIDRLLATADEEQADVVLPMMHEGDRGKHHYDGAVGFLEWDGVGGKRRLQIAPLSARDRLDGPASARRVDIAENHVGLYRVEALQRAGGFDERLTMNEFLNDALAFKHAGVSVIFEPRALATFLAPPPVQKDERPFFDFRWQPGAAEAACRHFEQVWGVDVLPWNLDLRGARAFLEARRHKTSRLRWMVYLVRTRWRWPLGRLKNRLLKLVPRTGIPASWRSGLS